MWCSSTNKSISLTPGPLMLMKEILTRFWTIPESNITFLIITLLSIQQSLKTMFFISTPSKLIWSCSSQFQHWQSLNSMVSAFVKKSIASSIHFRLEKQKDLRITFAFWVCKLFKYFNFFEWKEWSILFSLQFPINLKKLRVEGNDCDTNFLIMSFPLLLSFIINLSRFRNFMLYLVINSAALTSI